MGMKREAKPYSSTTAKFHTGIKISLLLAFLWSITPLYAATPWLHTDGNDIKDPAGNVVILRGVDMVDLGATQEWYGGATQMIDRLTNKSDPQGSSPGWYTRAIRIAVYPADEPGFTSPRTFQPGSDNFYNTLLRPVVDYCLSKDLYAIIDWHYVDDTFSHVSTTAEFWTYMAPRFAGESHVIYELFNEPINDVGDDTDDWLSVRTDMQPWIDIVRTYAPNNLILVAGASYSQIIGPAASYPVTGDNIAIVSHIYPGHWTGYWGDPQWYKDHITDCLTVYPVFMSEWGFSMSSGGGLAGTITNYGQPLMDFREENQISGTAWVASYDWGPPMFNTDWTLRVGEDEMGGFTKDMLYSKRSDNQPSGGDLTPPVAPTGLVATPGAGTVSLDWNNNGESDFYGYDIYRSTTSGTGYSKINLVRSKNSDYTDEDVVSGTTYYYVVRAVDTSFNQSGNSNEDSAMPGIDTTPPAAPTGLAATAGDGTVSLDWNNNSESDLAGYNVYRSTTSGSGYAKINISLVTNSDYTDNTVTNGITYYYVVTAVDTSSNESGYSNQDSATPVQSSQAPYPGPSAHAIPGRIEAENYDSGGEGVAYHDTTSDNSGNQYRSEDVDIETCGEGGYNVGWIAGGEWLEYTVYVATAGTYNIELRVASQTDGGNLHIEFDGDDVTGTLSFSATGAWQTFTSIYANDVILSEGQQVMRISMDSSNWNINWVEFASAGYQTCAEVQAAGYGLPSDLDGDCDVDYHDFETIAYYWLDTDCASNNDCDGADFEPTDGIVDFLDYSDFAEQWQVCNRPNDPGCIQNW